MGYLLPFMLSFAALVARAEGIASPGAPAEEDCRERALWDKCGRPRPDTDANDPDIAWTLLKNGNHENDRYAGVGAMLAERDKGTCTLTLIEPPGSCRFDKSRKAMAVTNGHCVGMMATAKTVVKDEPFSQAVAFHHFVEPKGHEVPSRVQRVLYATMQGTDLAVVELSSTYAELEGRDGKGPKAKRIARRFDGAQVANISNPTDYVDENDKYMRRSTCSAAGQAVVAEGPYLWPEQIRFKCSVTGGASGGPLINERTDEIQALMNTGVPYDPKGAPALPCPINRPCEVNGKEPKVETMNYGYNLTGLHACAVEGQGRCELKMDADGCKLPATNGPNVSAPSPNNLDPLGAAIDLDRVKTGESSAFTAFETKWGPAGSTDCAAKDGFTPAAGRDFRPPDKPRLADGVYVLCVRGKNRDGTWQAYKDSTRRSVRVDRTPIRPVLNPLPGKPGLYSIDPDTKDDVVTGYVSKWVRSPKECADKGGYKRPAAIEGRTLRPKETTGYICVRAGDMAGNMTDPAQATILNIETGGTLAAPKK